MDRNAKRLLKKQADKRMKTWQRNVVQGNLFFRTLSVSFNDTHLKLKLWCEVLAIVDQHTIRVRCFSVASPEGDEGDMHKSTVERLITPQEFEKAKRKEWQ